MSALKVGIIGCGVRTLPSGELGASMGWRHASGYAALGDEVDLVAVCDVGSPVARGSLHRPRRESPRATVWAGSLPP